MCYMEKRCRNKISSSSASSSSSSNSGRSSSSSSKSSNSNSSSSSSSSSSSRAAVVVVVVAVAQGERRVLQHPTDLPHGLVPTSLLHHDVIDDVIHVGLGPLALGELFREEEEGQPLLLEAVPHVLLGFQQDGVGRAVLQQLAPAPTGLHHLSFGDTRCQRNLHHAGGMFFFSILEGNNKRTKGIKYRYVMWTQSTAMGRRTSRNFLAQSPPVCITCRWG